MNKNTKKVVLTAGLSMGMCLSLISGATYALFTSESAHNITVSTAKVDVISNIVEETLKSYSYNPDMDKVVEGKLAYGTASISGSDVIVDNMVPGDKVAFDINISNKSSVNVQYRVKSTILSTDSNGENVESELVVDHSFASDWSELVPESEDIVVPVSITLPLTASTQGINYKVSFVVEAIQGNAKNVKVVAPSEAAKIDDMINELPDGSVLKLEDGKFVTDTKLIKVKKNITIDASNGTTLVDADGNPTQFKLDPYYSSDSVLTLKGLDVNKHLNNYSSVCYFETTEKENESAVLNLANNDKKVYTCYCTDKLNSMLTGDFQLPGDLVIRHWRNMLGVQPFFELNKNVNIDLNGHNIKFSDFEESSGVNEGVVPTLFAIYGNTKVTIKGEGSIDASYGKNETGYGFNINGTGAELNIENGNLIGQPTAIQVQKGTLNIKGGKFNLSNHVLTNEPEKAKYIINCIDANWKDGSAKINVTGGTFGYDINANPEGQGTSYCAEGYETKDNGDGTWTVVKKAAEPTPEAQA